MCGAVCVWEPQVVNEISVWCALQYRMAACCDILYTTFTSAQKQTEDVRNAIICFFLRQSRDAIP